MGLFIRLMLGDTTAHDLTGVMASPLMSPGNASKLQSSLLCTQAISLLLS